MASIAEPSLSLRSSSMEVAQTPPRLSMSQQVIAQARSEIENTPPSGQSAHYSSHIDNIKGDHNAPIYDVVFIQKTTPTKSDLRTTRFSITP